MALMGSSRKADRGLVDTAGEGKGGTDSHHMQNRQPVGICRMTQGAQPTALDNPEGWEVGGTFRRGGRMYTYGGFVLLYGRNQHNIVKQSSSIKIHKIFKMTKMVTFMCVYSATQLCSTLCDPMDCGLPDSSVQGIFQMRILEWVAISSSRGIFPTQGSNLCLLCLLGCLPLSHLGSPCFVYSAAIF